MSYPKILLSANNCMTLFNNYINGIIYHFCNTENKSIIIGFETFVGIVCNYKMY